MCWMQSLLITCWASIVIINRYRNLGSWWCLESPLKLVCWKESIEALKREWKNVFHAHRWFQIKIGSDRWFRKLTNAWRVQWKHGNQQHCMIRETRYTRLYEVGIDDECNECQGQIQGLRGGFHNQLYVRQARIVCHSATCFRGFSIAAFHCRLAASEPL